MKDGKLLRDALRKEMMNEKEVMAALRLKDGHEIEEIELATLEVDGGVSVIKHEWAEPLQKRDLA